jgi:MFS family permease
MGDSIFSRYDHQVWILLTGGLINTFGTSIAYPFVSLYLYEYRHVPMGYVGLALMIAASCGGLVQVLSGELCDRFGRKIMINAGLFLQMISFALLGYAIMSNTGFEGFILLMILKEIAGGLYRSIPQVMIADIVEPGERNGAFGLLRIGNNLGFALGPIFGGLLASYSYSLMFMLTAVTSGAYMLISIKMLHDTRPAIDQVESKAHHANILKDNPFLFYCIVGMLGSLVYSQLFTTYGTYSGSFVSLSASLVGILFSVNGFMVVFFQYPIARFLERFKLTTSLILGSLFYAVGFACVGFCTTFWMLFGAMFVITMGELVVTPSSQTMVAQMAPPEARGRYMSVNGFISYIGTAVGPAFGGQLMDTYSNKIFMMWVILGAIEIACAAGYLFLRLRLVSTMDRIQGIKAGPA